MTTISDEYDVHIPSINTIIYMQDSCDNIDADDRKNGWDAGIDYEIKTGKDAGDGGLFMYDSDKMPDPMDWTQMIPECIKYIYNLDTCPDYTIEEPDEA